MLSVGGHPTPRVGLKSTLNAQIIQEKSYMRVQVLHFIEEKSKMENETNGDFENAKEAPEMEEEELWNPVFVKS